MDNEALKALLATPAALAILMLFGTVLSMLQQYADAKSNDSTISFGAYFLKVETFITLGLNALAFGGLIVTDSLNWAAALGIGFAANNIADTFRPGKGRSAEVAEKVPDGFRAKE